MIHVVIVTILLVFLALSQYFLIKGLEDELKKVIERKVDEYTYSIRHKAQLEINKMSIISDAKKLQQIESIIERLERLDSQVRGDN